MIQRKSILWYIVLFFIFGVVFLLSLRKIYDVDIGFHLRGGEWMLENKSFHHYDVFTYTARNNEYVAMYWLYQIILYLVFKLSGDGGISIWNSILILLLFFLIFLRLRKSSVPLWLISILILLSIFPFEIRFGVRPEIFTYIFMVLMLIVLDYYFLYKKSFLFLLPLIQLLWANFHGLFILGWVVIGCYLISIFFTNKKGFIDMLKWAIVSIFVSFINPYHIKGILFPFYLFTRLQNSSVFKDAITEFASPLSERGFLLTAHSALFIYFLFFGLSFLLLLITRRHRKLHEYLLFISFGYLSCTAVRNIPLFIIIAIQITGTSIKDLLPEIKKKIQIPELLENGVAITVILFSFLFSLRIINNSYYAERGGGNFGIGFDPNTQPIKACEFIVKNRLTGRILNDLNRGSWLIWSVREPVYIDGRLEVMKESLFSEFHNSHEPGGLINLINKYNPSLIIFDYSYPEALFWDIDLENSPEWRMIYWDETSVIYAKKGYAEDLQTVSLYSTIQNLDIEQNLTEQAKWNILRKPTKSCLQLFFEGLYKKQKYPVILTRMAFYASVKLDFQTAEVLYLNALRIADYHLTEIYFRLGLIYHFIQDFAKAEYCYQRVLKEKPGHKKAQQMLNRLRQRLPPVQ
ncbi:MAG: tetratricopeptide repeat protein [candidate division WOR-3 bacterium]